MTKLIKHLILVWFFLSSRTMPSVAFLFCSSLCGNFGKFPPLQKRVVRFVFLKLFSGATEYSGFSVAPEKNFKPWFLQLQENEADSSFSGKCSKNCFDVDFTKKFPENVQKTILTVISRKILKWGKLFRKNVQKTKKDSKTVQKSQK